MATVEQATALDRATPYSIDGVVIGTLVGVGNNGATPIVMFAGQSGTGGLIARSSVDLPPEAIGREVVLAFDAGDPNRPIIIGLIRRNSVSSLSERPGHVEVDIDGERLLVTAKEQLVLRCGAASITLTKAGKILIQGSYVSSRASGVNRIKGGSIQLN